MFEYLLSSFDIMSHLIFGNFPDHISAVLHSTFRDILPTLAQSLQTSMCIMFQITTALPHSTLPKTNVQMNLTISFRVTNISRIT